jgi:hypothetical protein
MRQGSWNPMPAESVLVSLSWLGTLALPVCGCLLWRTARDLERIRAFPDAPKTKNLVWAFIGVSAALAVLLAGLVGWSVIAYSQAKRAMAEEQKARSQAQRRAAERALLPDGGETPAH